MSTSKSLQAGLLVLAVAGGALAPRLTGAETGVFFQENFRNYGNRAPGCADNPGIVIGNDPVWTQSAEANCRMTESGFVFKDFQPAAKNAADLKNVDVLFRFRFQSDKDPRFQLHLRNQGVAPKRSLIVTLSPTGVVVSSEGLNPAVAAEAAFSAPIPQNQWRDAAVTFKDGRLTVSLEAERLLKPVLATPAPALAAPSVNFFGFKDAPFSLGDIVVRQAAPLPDNTITRLLPAPRTTEAAALVAGGSRTVAANDMFGATIRTGLDKDAVKLVLNWGDGKTNGLTFGVAGIPEQRKIKKDGKDTTEKFERPDAMIQVRGITAKGPLNYYIRPMLRRYHTSYSFTDTYHDILRDWDLLPKASEHLLKVELRRTGAGADLYLDSCYAGSVTGAVLKDVTFTLAPSAATLGNPFSVQAKHDPAKFLPLDIAALGMAKTFADAKVSLKPGLSEVKGIPLFVADGAGSADIGLAREGQGNWALEVDEYLARSPFDGLLTEIHFTVPGGAPYSKAWALCAVDPDPAKDPVLTARLAHYVENGCGNNQLADTVVRLPRGGEKPGAGVVPVGTVSKKGSDGKTLELPLYLVEIPLKSGAIMDLLMGKPQMNFEFFGKPWENFEQIDNSSKPDPRSTSAVQVFGVTLEKAPVGMDLVQAQPANIFHNAEKPETTVILKSFAPARGKLAWEILDAEGRKAGGGAADYSFARAGETQRVVIPLNVPELGWYELPIAVQDGAGQPLFVHPARFARLGQDTRQAGYESPFGTWWFDGAHNTPKELDFAGPVMFKAGIRMVAWTGKTETDMEKWRLTKDQINMSFSFRDLPSAEELAKDPGAGAKKAEAAIKKAEETMAKQLKAYPHAREVVVFHESGPGNDVPVELIGLKPDLTEAQMAREKRYADLINLAGAFYRKNYPQLKMVVGNNSCAAANIAAILRHGGNPDYIDYIGIEAPSQVYTPEKLQEWALQGHHMSRETAKLLSGRDIPATGCYEFTYRSERDMGEQQQAEWYARDVLISLANKFTRIGPGILFDTANAYFNGLWGASGILQRGPYGYPKRAYVAYAVITEMFDRVRLHRQVPTGSTTLYAVEFERADKQFATALWAARGEADFVVEFAGDTPVKVVDMYGRPAVNQKTAGGKLTVRAGTSPAYVLSGKAITGVTIGARSFPKDEARARLAKVAAPLASAEAVALDRDSNLDTRKVAPLQTPIRQLGDFELRQSQDEQKGACLELELKTDKNKDLSKYITEYTTVRLNTPVAVEGTPSGLGVWVKGNSNWGRVMFEIEDADGEVWRSVGTGGWGCDVLDWPGNAAVNFDGWNFVSLPLRDTPLFNDHSPGPVLEQWVSGGGNKAIDFPIKARALIVEMNRTPLDLIDFKAARPVIRLKDLGAF